MKLGFTPEQEAFREEIAAWFNEKLNGDFRAIKDIKTLTGESEKRLEWERVLGAEGWGAIGYPKELGGRDASLAEQVIYAEEYAKAGGPGRMEHIGVELAGPTLLHFGSEEQQKRFIPGIVAGTTMWAQGYSEPNAGSDLSNVQTKAELIDGKWIINGQKIWTSFCHIADWIFIVARTEPDTKGPKGLSFLLVPLDQPGVDIRPITQITGEAEFNEVFFDNAETEGALIVGERGKGWRVAMGLLAFERGVGTLGQVASFAKEFDILIEKAKETGADKNPLIRQKIGEAFTGLAVMRHSALRTLSNTNHAQLEPAAMTSKLYWSAWHKKFTELGMEICGASGLLEPQGTGQLEELPWMYLNARADSIYGGTNQIQRNIVAERALGLPR